MTKRKRNQTVCTCDAYPFPHRLGGGKCYGEHICPHGVITHEHPDWDGEGCMTCAREAYADHVYDSRIDRMT